MKTFTILLSLLILLGCQNESERLKSEHIADSILEKAKKDHATSQRQAIAKRQNMLQHNILGEINFLKAGYPEIPYDQGADQLNRSLVIFDDWASLMNEADTSKNDIILELSNKLMRLASKVQNTEFPKMRTGYMKLMAQKMWENDIYASCTGPRNTILNISGGFFAANINIMDYQSTIRDIVVSLRYKEVRYRWYKGANEFTYYKLNVPADNEIVRIAH